MKPYKSQAHIHSLNGEMDEITIIDKVGVTTTLWTTRA